MHVYIYLLIFILLAYGLQKILKIILKIDSNAGRKNIKIHKKRQLKETGNSTFDVLIKPCILALSRILVINPYKEQQLKDYLLRAKIPFTPKEYYAKSIIYSIIPLLFIPFLYLLGIQETVPLMIVLTVLIFHKQNSSAKKIIKKREDAVMHELPRFIRSVTTGLRTDRDIIKLIEKYTVVADALKFDLELLLSDMKSGNIETALLRFSERVYHPHVTRLTNALINIDKGVDQSSTLDNLASDMITLARENIKKELAKRPRKVNCAYIPSALIGIAIFMYVIIANVSASLTAIFG